MAQMKTLTINNVKYDLVDANAVSAPATADVGQTIVVKSVDENGKPTEWEAVDFPESSGGVTSWNDLMDRPTETISVDTLTWDGNTDGLEMVDFSDGEYLCHVSDVVPAMNDFASGCSLELNIAGTIGKVNVAAEEISELDDGGGLVINGGIVVIPTDNYTSDGVTFPIKGTYFLCIPSEEIYMESLTIPGYTGFAKEVLKPEILPRAAILYTDGTYLYNTEDTMSETNRISKAKLLAHVRSEDVVKIARSIDGVTAIYFASVVSISNAYPYGIVVVSAGSDALDLYTAEYTAEQGTHDRQKAPPI